ncbi:alpha-ketoacid dehydrogenase subunit beta [Salinicoccus carnicancri]|uniref:alpha-ketoacid dehydrogenase subunit beta n=1 Tax=Salinicoccus carnicancri TaxID=558170 RepID=UPI0002D3B8F3|nr:alpha-ketoacid dehydrogenase subunit beta [Salinicoccus carnicancri]
MRQLTIVQALNEALAIKLQEDGDTLVFGEDIGKNGGVFRVTDGLQDKFGENRVFDTPLAESGILGMSIGLAENKFRPVPELQFFGFVLEAMDSIAGQMSRYRYRTGGTKNLPITIRAPFGGGVHTPELHSDSFEGMVTQAPGIRVVVPSSPYDAKGLLISSIESDDPVLFLEHLKLYRSVKEEVPKEKYTVPLDKANIVRAGDEVTVVAYGQMVHEAVLAAEKSDASVEIIDLRTISPIDMDTIEKSVKKTGNVVVVQEAQRSSGVMGNLSGEIAEHCFMYLESPPKRVTPPDTTFAFGAAENIWIPDSVKIEETIRETLEF